MMSLQDRGSRRQAAPPSAEDGPHFAAATRSHRLFLELHHLIHERAADLRRSGRDVCVGSNRTVDAEFRGTRIEIVVEGVEAYRLLYRCDGGARPWPDPDRPHLQDRMRNVRYYALRMNETHDGSPFWSPRADGGEPHHTNRELVSSWLVLSREGKWK